MIKVVVFIGLGNMGGLMAKNLAAEDFDVLAFDQSDQAMATAVANGCSQVTDLPSALADADAVVTMLPNDKIVTSVLAGELDIAASTPGHCLFIDCSTVAPQTSRHLAQSLQAGGRRFIDAPVSGGTAAADKGTLAFMCGGSEEDIQRATPLLRAMGANIFRAGDCGAGATAKLCNNLLLAIQMAGTAEALKLGMNNGLDPKVLSSIMQESSGANWSLEKYNPVPEVMAGVPSSNNYQGGFMTDLMLKDLGLALSTAANSGSMTPMGSVAQSLFSIAKSLDERDGKSDFSKIFTIFQ